MNMDVVDQASGHVERCSHAGSVWCRGESVTSFTEVLGIDVVEARAHSGFTGKVLGASWRAGVGSFGGTGGTSGVEFVSVAKVVGVGRDLATGHKEVVEGFVVGVTEETACFGVVEAGQPGVTGHWTSNVADDLDSVFGGYLSDWRDYVGVEVLGACWVVCWFVIDKHLNEEDTR